MKSIIIVGRGKASRIHTMSYNKFSQKMDLYYADIDLPIGRVMEDNKLNPRDVIVDIVTPKEVFFDIIQICEDLGIYNIIVEKPFVCDSDFFKKHSKLNIIMVQNYIYSLTTNFVKDYLDKYGLKIKSIITNFSKNRIDESINMRGMSKLITENFEIEIPHQLYIADYLIGGESDLLLLEQKDMNNSDRILKNHGYSFSLVKNSDRIVSHQSDLTSNTLHKGLVVYCENDICIDVEYSIYNKNLECLKNSRVCVYKNRELILEKEIVDDNMYYCLKNYYDYFESGTYNKLYKQRILSFSKIMTEYKEFSKKYCK